MGVVDNANEKVMEQAKIIFDKVESKFQTTPSVKTRCEAFIAACRLGETEWLSKHAPWFYTSTTFLDEPITEGIRILADQNDWKSITAIAKAIYEKCDYFSPWEWAPRVTLIFPVVSRDKASCVMIKYLIGISPPDREINSQTISACLLFGDDECFDLIQPKEKSSPLSHSWSDLKEEVFEPLAHSAYWSQLKQAAKWVLAHKLDTGTHYEVRAYYDLALKESFKEANGPHSDVG